MEDKRRLNEQISKFQHLDSDPSDINQKLDELISLLEQSNLDSDSVIKIQNKFNKAIEARELTQRDLRAFETLDEDKMTRIEIADNLESLLSKYQVDNKVTKKFQLAEKSRQLTVIVISIIMIALGFAMIIMPAPPYFEMFTIYYFTRDDGITLMDLISLLIVFTGVYLLLTSLIKLNRQK